MREREVPSRQGFPLLIRDLNAPIPKAGYPKPVTQGGETVCESRCMVLGRFSIRKVDIELPLSFGYMDVIQRHFNVGLIFSLAVNNADCIQFLKSGDDSAFPKSPAI